MEDFYMMVSDTASCVYGVCRAQGMGTDCDACVRADALLAVHEHDTDCGGCDARSGEQWTRALGRRAYLDALAAGLIDGDGYPADPRGDCEALLCEVLDLAGVPDTCEADAVAVARAVLDAVESAVSVGDSMEAAGDFFRGGMEKAAAFDNARAVLADVGEVVAALDTLEDLRAGRRWETREDCEAGLYGIS